MAADRYMTGYNIVKAVLQVMGLPVPLTVAGATDATSTQIWAILTDLGQEIMGEYQWQLRTKTWTFTSDPLTKNYDLPADFDGFVDSTDWNNTARIPLIGPMTEQQWALLTARQLGGTTLRLQYRINNDQLQLYYSPSEPNELSLTYKSRAWVQDGEDPLLFKDHVEKDTDIVLFDPLMMKKGLRYKWRSAKGFDTVTLEREFNDAKDIAKNKDTPGADLYLGNAASDYPYLGYFNMPDTGYGQS